MTPTDDTGASVGAAPAAAARGVLERNFPDLGCGGQFGEQNSSIGRKPQPQQILTAIVAISTIRRRSAVLSHVVRARVRTGTRRHGHWGAAAAAAASAATGS